MFLDREPYIRYWRPTYRVIGPFTRFARSLTGGIGGLLLAGMTDRLRSVELRLAEIESRQREFQKSQAEIESRQREFQKSQAEFHKMIERLLQFSDLQLRNAAMETDARKAEWGALEHLLIAFIGTSSRESLTPAEMYANYRARIE
jgi:hypothetical protein